MEFVQDKTFYHVQLIRPGIDAFRLGKTYNFGENKNRFYSFYDNFSTTNSNTNEYINFSREAIFEEVRRGQFPDCPSRRKCLWLIDKSNNLSNALFFWFKELFNKQTDTGVRIVSLCCSGNIHHANQKFLYNNLYNFHLLRGDAIKYWQGSDANPDDCNTEVLLEGTAKVLSGNRSIFNYIMTKFVQVEHAYKRIQSPYNNHFHQVPTYSSDQSHY